ncbi:MAG: MGMT family protein [Sedimentisphaerales bacterium]|nr:MGMT family protein [Sedimentisphaerales bacterium]
MAGAHTRRKSGREKLENPAVEGLPKVVEVPEKWRKSQGGRWVLVPTPSMADAEVRTVPKGKLITTGQIRRRLAEREKADSTCPMTLGIFLQIISQAAEEDRLAGREPIAPYWRVVKEDGSLNPKFVGGAEAQAEKLVAEGHTIVPGKGKKPPRVEDFEKALV